MQGQRNLDDNQGDATYQAQASGAAVQTVCMYFTYQVAV